VGCLSGNGWPDLPNVTYSLSVTHSLNAIFRRAPEEIKQIWPTGSLEKSRFFWR
jgi:hypothetical protein